jgi:hypothetical protein
MHDFLGTFNGSQFARLADFATKQVSDVDARIQHLTAERIRIGVISFKFDKGAVDTYNATPGSYIGKLLAAYETLGGDPYHDLQIRANTPTQAIHVVRGDENSSAKRMSDGRVVGTEGLADSSSALLVQKLQGWMHEAGQYKREALERKIRRALDYADQITEEIQLLGVIKQGKETDGSVANIIDQIRQLMADRNYRAISDDKGQDPNGLMAYAPYAAYEPGPSRPSTGYNRTLDGYSTPEDKG